MAELKKVPGYDPGQQQSSLVVFRYSRTELPTSRQRACLGVWNNTKSRYVINTDRAFAVSNDKQRQGVGKFKAICTAPLARHTCYVITSMHQRHPAKT